MHHQKSSVTSGRCLWEIPQIREKMADLCRWAAAIGNWVWQIGYYGLRLMRLSSAHV
jgi:hypothetical protein